MRWDRRLKWLKISKLVIPIALAVSIVFAGVSVYGTDAQNFVIKTQNQDEVNLSLSINKDLSNATSYLNIPINGSQTNTTFKYNDYKADIINENAGYIPNNVAQTLGATVGRNEIGDLTYIAFGFYLINNSKRAVDYDMELIIDSVIYNSGNTTGRHIEDAMRVMLIEGEPLLYDKGDVAAAPFTVYAKDEKSEEERNELVASEAYTDTINFESDYTVFKNRIYGLEAGEVKKYTIVLWLEGNDPDCKSFIIGEQVKMSLSFTGY